MFDLLAGQKLQSLAPIVGRRASVLVFDSGLGGLTVAMQLCQIAPDLDLHYIADEAYFPYGSKPETLIRERVVEVLRDYCARLSPDLVVIACNTASTLALREARQVLDVPVIGTVPPIKPAAEFARGQVAALLGTPVTMTRAYTHALISAYADGVEVVPVGSQNLAVLAETFVRDGAVDEDAVRDEILPCFIDKNGIRTVSIALSCTHYPWLLPVFKRVQPWPVAYFDPAPAVARRVQALLAARMPLKGEGARTWGSTNEALSGLLHTAQMLFSQSLPSAH